MVGDCGFVPTAMCGPPALVQARLITVCFRLPYILPRGWLLRRNAAAILQLQAYFTDRIRGLAGPEMLVSTKQTLIHVPWKHSKRQGQVK